VQHSLHLFILPLFASLCHKVRAISDSATAAEVINLSPESDSATKSPWILPFICYRCRPEVTFPGPDEFIAHNKEYDIDGHLGEQ
jgi:hypothetical protein